MGGEAQLYRYKLIVATLATLIKALILLSKALFYIL